MIGAVVPLIHAVLASAVIYWNGDFDTGNLNQWSGVQKAPAPYGEIAAEYLPLLDRYQLHARLTGDEPLVSGGKRSEVVQARSDLIMREGDVMTLRWSHRMPRENPVDSRWLVWTQFHHLGGTGSPPVEFCVHGETVSLRVLGSVLWSTTRTAWLSNYPNMHRLDLRVKWSNSSASGWVELWLDGKVVLSKTATRTLVDAGAYLKMGIYRHPDMTSTMWFYNDDVEMWIDRP